MIKLDCSETKMTSRAAIEELVKTGVKVIKGDVIGTASGFYKAYKAYAPVKPTPYQSAYMFWRAVFWLAITDALTRNRIGRMAGESTLSGGIEWLLKTVFDPDEPGEFGLEHLMEPTSWSLYHAKLRPKFPEFAASLEDAHTGFSEEELCHQLDISMRASLYDVWENDGFWEFRDFISTCRDDPVFESLMRRRKWRRHYAWIESSLSGRALFGQDEDSGITLRSVYTPLRCAWEEVKDLPREPGEDNIDEVSARAGKRQKRLVHVDWLESALEGWLDDVPGTNSTDSLRVLAGGPGSGKSTVARTLAAEVAQEEIFNVCFIELQHFNFGGNLRTSLLSELDHGREGVGLGGDPIKWQDETDPRPLLFVFDGLDELVNRDKLDEDITQGFIQKVCDFLRDLNRGKVRALAIVTGRPGAVSTAFDRVNVDRHALLEVMPLTSLEGHDFLEARHAEGPLEVLDPRNLLDEDHRGNFWGNWCKGSRQEEAGLPAVLQVRELDEFTCEPLLFYLLNLSGFATNPEQAVTNKNVIYRKIFEKVHERDRIKREERGDEEISREQFFLLMECLGLAIWHGGGRTGSDERFEAIREWHTGREKKKLALMAASSLKNVAMQFYTRNDTAGGDAGFEFIHKSFGEYLTACALARIGRVLAASEDPEEEVAAKWLKRTGQAQITHEIIGFLRDEFKQLPSDLVLEIKAGLTEQLNWALAHGMPAHAEKIEGTWRDAETRQRNATGALLSVLNAAYWALPSGKREQTSLDWPDAAAARRLLDALHVTSEVYHPHGQVLSGLDFSLSRKSEDSSGRPFLAYLMLQGISFCEVNLREANLQEADLQGADLRGAMLRGARLRGAMLLHADLRGANLQEADLQGADLRGVNLQEANLQEADLQGAILRRAILRRAMLQAADLQEAMLQHADLRGANLQEADLRRADLRRANLQEADLQGADLRRANLQEADLQGADTSDADFQHASLVSVQLNLVTGLVQDQINSAFGDAVTAANLPVGMKPPEHWAKEELDPVEAYQSWRAWVEGQLVKSLALDVVGSDR